MLFGLQSELKKLSCKLSFPLTWNSQLQSRCNLIRRKESQGSAPTNHGYIQPNPAVIQGRPKQRLQLERRRAWRKGAKQGKSQRVGNNKTGLKQIVSCTGFVFKCEKRVLFKLDLKNALQIKHVLSKLDLKNCLQAFFKYDLENALQTKWHLENWKQMLCTVLFLSVRKRALFKLDLKIALRAFFKNDLENALQTKWRLGYF